MSLDDAFLQACDHVVDRLGDPQVAERWSAPSALPRLSVGALAVHLGNQVVRAAAVLPQDPGDLPVLASADEHYARSTWPTAPPEDPVNDRSADEHAAVAGPEAVLAGVLAHREQVRTLLAGSLPAVVAVPWAGWAMRREDFLLTRMLEVVVHSDDLAASLGVPAAVVPDAVFAPVRDLLVRLAVARHGQSRVVAALTRSERAAPVSAF